MPKNNTKAWPLGIPLRCTICSQTTFPWAVGPKPRIAARADQRHLYIDKSAELIVNECKCGSLTWINP